METTSVFLLLAMAGTQLASQWLSAIAYRLARVATVAPVQYSQMLWIPLLGSLLWNERPTVNTWVGVFLIAVGGVWLLRSEAR